LIIIGFLTQIFEIPRVYNGATNVDVFNNMTDGLYIISNYYNHWWPWTYAANLFGIFTFVTGIVGILTGRRKPYASIFVFFTMSVVSASFAIYFGFIISFYHSLGKDKTNNRTSAESVSYGLGATQLAISLINIIMSLLSAILAGRSIALCVDKSVKSKDIYLMTPRPRPRVAYNYL
jgi:Na+/proline symporter